MTLEELLSKCNGEYISYAQYLATEEWKTKRNSIIERDKNICTKCKKGATIYIKNFGSPQKYHLWNIRKSDNKMLPWTDFEDSQIENADKHYHLEVHHKRYILNRLPWEYNSDDLITFCNHCHSEFHQHNKVVVYSEDEMMKLDYQVCPKCNGAGYLPEYSHVENGVCFQCMGERYTQPLIKW